MQPARHAPARLGVLVPAGNPTVEPELYRMAPGGLTIHFARLVTAAGAPGAPDGMARRALAYLDSLADAAGSLADLRPGLIVLAHTAVSYLNGFDREPELIERLARLARAPAVTAARAILAALAHLGARRLALATPYPEVIGTAARAYWEAGGLEVVAHCRLDSPDIYAETEESALALGRQADVPAADCVLISGTGLPTAGIVERLEAELGKPVVTSQAAMLWHALGALGLAGLGTGHGRLLAGTGRPA